LKNYLKLSQKYFAFDFASLRLGGKQENIPQQQRRKGKTEAFLPNNYF